MILAQDGEGGSDIGGEGGSVNTPGGRKGFYGWFFGFFFGRRERILRSLKINCTVSVLGGKIKNKTSAKEIWNCVKLFLETKTKVGR